MDKGRNTFHSREFASVTTSPSSAYCSRFISLLFRSREPCEKSHWIMSEWVSEHTSSQRFFRNLFGVTFINIKQKTLRSCSDRRNGLTARPIGSFLCETNGWGINVGISIKTNHRWVAVCGNYAKINASFVEKQSERKPEDVDRREGSGAHMRVAIQCKNTR